MKLLLAMALRQTTAFVESLMLLVGLDRTVPDFSTRKNAKPLKRVTARASAQNDVLRASQNLGRVL
jgi:hypothetical protein